jgi:hypothetical protein
MLAELREGYDAATRGDFDVERLVRIKGESCW